MQANRKPCEPLSEQKKHKHWRRCKWQFNTLCLSYVDEAAIEKGYALYRDRRDVTSDECKLRFLPIDDNLVSGEQDYCRRPGVFVEMQSSNDVKRQRNPKTGKVEGYIPSLFGDNTKPTIGMVQRPEEKQEY